jgi:hypothetical protein
MAAEPLMDCAPDHGTTGAATAGPRRFHVSGHRRCSALLRVCSTVLFISRILRVFSDPLATASYRSPAMFANVNSQIADDLPT